MVRFHRPSANANGEEDTREADSNTKFVALAATADRNKRRKGQTIGYATNIERKKERKKKETKRRRVKKKMNKDQCTAHD